MDFENIIYTVEDGIATIKLNRPKALNALNSAINQDIMAAINLVKADPSVRVLIMTGSERAFAAGADVKEMAEAVGGFAFGGGCEMTLACDFRVGGSRTTLSFPEVGLGIIPGANGCARATAIVGPAKAKQLVMLTEMIPGKQAYDLGLLNWFAVGDADLDAAAKAAKAAVKAAKASGNEEELAAAKAALKSAEGAAAKAEYDAIMAKAVDVAKKLMGKPACALASAKAAINKAAIETIAAGKAQETTEFTLLFDTHDQKEGMAAMIEKRPAVFTNN